MRRDTLKFNDVRAARLSLKRLLPESLPIVAKWNGVELPPNLSEEETREYIFRTLYPRAGRL